MKEDEKEESLGYNQASLRRVWGRLNPEEIWRKLILSASEDHPTAFACDRCGGVRFHYPRALVLSGLHTESESHTHQDDDPRNHSAVEDHNEKIDAEHLGRI